jgi:hypothetical protein
MKKILRNIIYFLIEKLEKIEYKNEKLDENDPLKKILNVLPLKDLLVETDYGFVPIEEINLTQPYTSYKLELENGIKMNCADVHAVFCDGHIIKFVKDLTLNDIIITKKGNSKVKYITKSNHKVSMFDLSLNSNEHSYYTNDILSLNTVSAAIVMLWTVLFNKDKGVMVVANKSTTVKEIVRKIKDIYKLLPFFLKTGIVNWNEKTLAFENGSRIQSENRTKEPAIGFTIDLLYLDEFAKIPDNIVRAYYASVVPTVSSISNSKIIITSTPDGHNLFYELLRDSELPEGDIHKNPYKSLKVYWFQIKGRRDTKIKFIDEKLQKYGLTEDYVLNYLRNELEYKLYDKVVDGKVCHYIKWYEDDEKTPMIKADIIDIRSIRIESKMISDNGIEEIFEVPLPEICFITNWQEEETTLIGGEGKFDQEYGLQFITDGNLLFDSAVFETFLNNETKFSHLEIPSFENKLKYPYSDLKWIENRPDLFDIRLAKNYDIFVGIDMGEGLGQNYTVISIFRLMMKDKDTINKKKFMYENKYDLFKLEQIGVFQNNIYNPNEIAHILYLIAFELFDHERVKIVIEKNKNLGDRLLDNLKHVFNDINNYGDSIFVRYKQNETDDYLTVGFLVKSGEKGKKMMLKDFQDVIKKDAMILRHSGTIGELSSFSKKELANGEVTFKSQSGTDDCVMAIINLATIYRHTDYKNIIDTYLDFRSTDVEKEIVKNFMEITPYENNVNYKSFRMARKQFINKVDMLSKAKPNNPWQNNNTDEVLRMNPWKQADPWSKRDEEKKNPLFWPNSQKIKFWPKGD